MPNERLSLNIFPGIMPGPLVYLDDCSDPSKWVLGVAPGAWTSVNTGDLYGYYGKGLRFVAPDTSAARNVWATRPILPCYSPNYEWGFLVRPVVGFIHPVLADDHIFAIRFTNLFLRNTGSTRPWFEIQFTPSDLGMGQEGFEVRLAYSNGVGITTLPLGITYIHDGEWLRVFGIMSGSAIRRVQVGPTPYPVDVTPTIAAVVDRHSAADVMIRYVFAGGALGKDIPTWDVGQLWVSDTENIV